MSTTLETTSANQVVRTTDHSVTIRSTSDDNTRYVFLDWEHTIRHAGTRDTLGDHVGTFNTMGDGETAHTPTSPVHVSRLPDVLKSIMACIPEWGADCPEVVIRFLVHARPSRTLKREDVELLDKQTEYKGEAYQRLYVNFNDMKFSRSESKANRRDWHECNRYMLPGDPSHKNYAERVTCYQRFFGGEGSPWHCYNVVGSVFLVAAFTEAGAGDSHVWSELIEKDWGILSGITFDQAEWMLRRANQLSKYVDVCKNVDWLKRVGANTLESEH